MKNSRLFLGLVLALVAILCSCSKTPDYYKLIPDDAQVYYRADIKQIIEKSGIVQNPDIKSNITDAIKNLDLNKKNTNKLLEVLDNPEKIGLDLRDPFVFYYSETKKSKEGSLVGHILDKDDFESFLTLLVNEFSDDISISHKKDITYLFIDELGIFFDKKSLYISPMLNSDDEYDFVKEVIEKFEGDGKGTFATNEVKAQFMQHEGLMQTLINGNLFDRYIPMEDMPDELADLDFSKIDWFMELAANNGELSLSYEIITEDKEWKKLFDKCQFQESITGSLCQYIPEKSFACFTNINSEKLIEYLDEFGVFELIKKNTGYDTRYVEDLVTSLSGEMAFSLYDTDERGKVPSLSIYAKASGDEVIQFINKELIGDQPEMEDGYYQIVTAYDYKYDYYSWDYERVPLGYLKYGYKNETIGFCNDTVPSVFETVDNPFDEKLLKGKTMYAYLDADFIKDLVNKVRMDKKEKAVTKKVIRIFDYAELYSESSKKVVLKFYFKDKEANSLATLTNICIELAEEI